MFDKPAAQPIEDIFSDVVQPGPPSALAQGKLQPVLPGAAHPAPPLSQMTPIRSGRPILKTALLLMAGLAVVGALALAAWWWWQSRGVPSAVVPSLGAPTNPINNKIDQALDQFNQKAIQGALNPLAPAATETPVAPAPTPAAESALDTDQDGLTDAQEYQSGTNPRLVDSDTDGLSDWEEVSIFGSDPLKSDTDGDGYLDGSEVQNGYNPKGPGKLLDFEKAR